MGYKPAMGVEKAALTTAWSALTSRPRERDPYFGNMKGSEGIPHFVLEGGS